MFQVIDINLLLPIEVLEEFHQVRTGQKAFHQITVPRYLPFDLEADSAHIGLHSPAIKWLAAGQDLEVDIGFIRYEPNLRLVLLDVFVGPDTDDPDRLFDGGPASSEMYAEERLFIIARIINGQPQHPVAIRPTGPDAFTGFGVDAPEPYLAKLIALYDEHTR